MMDLYKISPERLKEMRKIDKKLAIFLSRFSKENILSTKNKQYSKLEGFDSFDDKIKRIAFGVINPTRYFLEEFNGQESMEELAKKVGKEDIESENLKDIKHSTMLSFYLACRMLKLYPKKEKYKKFKKDVEEYLGIEPY